MAAQMAASGSPCIESMGGLPSPDMRTPAPAMALTVGWKAGIVACGPFEPYEAANRYTRRGFTFWTSSYSRPRFFPGVAAEVLHQRVGLGDDSVENLAALRCLEVERDALLALDGLVRDLVDAAHEIAEDRLDLDNPSPHLGQQRRRERAGVVRGHLKDGVAFQRQPGLGAGGRAGRGGPSATVRRRRARRGRHPYAHPSPGAWPCGRDGVAVISAMGPTCRIGPTRGSSNSK